MKAFGIDAYNQALTGETAPCLHCTAACDLDHVGGVLIVKSAGFKPRNGAESRSIGYGEEMSPVLVNDGSAGGVAVVIENNTHPRQEVCTAYDITSYNSNAMKSPTPDSCFKPREVSKCLDGFVGTPLVKQGGTVVVIDKTIAISPKQISLATEEDIACTLAANDYKEPQTVCYENENTASGYGNRGAMCR